MMDLPDHCLVHANDGGNPHKQLIFVWTCLVLVDLPLNSIPLVNLLCLEACQPPLYSFLTV